MKPEQEPHPRRECRAAEDLLVQHLLQGREDEPVRDAFTHQRSCARCTARWRTLHRDISALTESWADAALEGGAAPGATPERAERIWGRIADGVGAERMADLARDALAGGGAGDPSGFVGRGSPWFELPFDGVRCRVLSEDPDSDRRTMLLALEPGASFPEHEHRGAEELFVIEGDLLCGALELHDGDYQRMEAGSIHGAQTTRDGCLVLVIGSRRDQLPGG